MCLIMKMGFLVFFWKTRLRSITCFSLHQKILILAPKLSLVEGQHTWLILLYVCDFYLRISQKLIFQTLKSIFHNFRMIILNISRYSLRLICSRNFSGRYNTELSNFKFFGGPNSSMLWGSKLNNFGSKIKGLNKNLRDNSSQNR